MMVPIGDTAREAGETARSAIDVFKQTPIVFALIIMNLALLALVYWNGVVGHQERSRSLELLYSNHEYIGNLLARCNVRPNG